MKKEALSFARAIIAAHDFVFDNKAESITVLRAHMKDLDASQAEGFYRDMTEKGALHRKPEIQRDGVQAMLKLRNKYAEPRKTLTDPDKYLDLGYYRKASQ